MSDLLGRAYQVAKAYLDSARGRLEEIDARAQEELRRSLPREDAPTPPSPLRGRGAGGEGGAGTYSNDPFERATAKIAEAQQRVAAQRQEAERREAATAPPPDPVATAYMIIGVPNGSDYLTVESAVNKLRARCAPARFPDGSPEQADAQVILQRVEEAFQVLKNALGTAGGGRFDKLEL
ncbi:MAG: hypothetical protein JO250_21415 [Armatimonadetes bacterium]|nr:hypothetical protein [Armatimonadota bacterium]